MKHPEYTHLIWHAQDLVVKLWNFELLKKDILENDFPVYAGVCNIDHKKYKDKLNITSNLPALDFDNRRYYWISKNRYPNMILQVPFTGGAMYCVRYDVSKRCHISKVRNWQTREERPVWEVSGGYANDLAYAHNLHEAGIPIHVNTTNIMDHLRYEYDSKIGIKQPKVKFIPYQSKGIDIEPEVQVRSLRTQE